jgi:hypothetical protein
MAERCRGREWSHPLGARALANRMRDLGTGLYPAGYKLVRRALHARKGLALDRNEAQTNEEMSDKEYCDLFDNVTDEVHPQVLRRWRTASRLRDLTAHLISNQEESIKIAKRHRNPLTAAPSYKSRCDAVALGSNISVPAPFVWRCLSGSTVSPFPHLAHRTGQADLPHPALGQDLTPSPTARRVRARLDVRARSARRGARVDKSRPCVA